MKKEFNLFEAFIPFVILFALTILSATTWKVGMFVPIIISIALTSIFCIMKGIPFKEIEVAMISAVTRVIPVIFILLTIGMIIGTWISSGIIPTIIYYSVKLMSAQFFIPLSMIIISIISVSLGSSFTSLATIGIAFFGVGTTLGFNPALVAGALISGAFFGDKISPLSDTTNIAPAIVGTDLYTHIKGMLVDTIPSYLLALIIFYFLGANSAVGKDMDSNLEILPLLEKSFNLNPLLLLIPVLVVLFLVTKPAVLPSLFILIFAGIVLTLVVQGGSISGIANVLTDGYIYDGKDEIVANLLNKGGVSSMLNIIGLLIVAIAYGGIIEETGIIHTIKDRLMKHVKSSKSLIVATVLTSLAVGFGTGAQVLAIILPGRLFVEDYKKFNVAPQNLSRCIESAGTVGINIVPWSVPCIFASGLFNLDPLTFIPFSLFAIITPIMTCLLGVLDIGVVKIKKEVEVNE